MGDQHHPAGRSRLQHLLHGLLLHSSTSLFVTYLFSELLNVVHEIYILEVLDLLPL